MTARRASAPSGEGEAGIHGQALSKSYGSARRAVHAVRDVSLKVRSSEFLAIIGPSGCGKTTLLRMVAGLETPTSGTISCWGRSPAELAREHRIGMVFQDPALLPWASLRRNVEFVYRAAGRRPDHERVHEALDLVGLTSLAHLRPHEASGGMRQRTALARALVMEPSLLLLDEPFGALDAITRRRLNGELERVWTAVRPTTVLITHSVEEAVMLADRVVVMSDRPATILREVTVPLARPRPTVLDETFRDTVRECMEALDA
ncbi:ABC transporter ATP-binding protein [Streptosporangium sp. NPDC049644]|uniref:ABC transporter ATP-binding protein n=1 Tax=Streptosporangium sp. NPDC049644 TaxID=3155507 RepID=UPI003429D9B3